MSDFWPQVELENGRQTANWPQTVFSSRYVSNDALLEKSECYMLRTELQQCFTGPNRSNKGLVGRSRPTGLIFHFFRDGLWPQTGSTSIFSEMGWPQIGSTGVFHRWAGRR
ncbi:hypothetical protein O6H91_09G093100 [Diphasiastrum complanatum]|uniref:Uncharacterized protein n=1 Tax=Diphasiastrum complanatum TaxID=34168 RepID=A0ACC2CRV3_DIPCM|nr:hypothetical protein O6H91_09G093100 [Diphasiastrum complanatum]